MFPHAQIFLMGVCGPGSNTHSPNENLDIDYTKKLTCCMA